MTADREAAIREDDCTCLTYVDGLGSPTGKRRRDPNCPSHGPLLAELAAAREEIARYPETARKLGWLDPNEAAAAREREQTLRDALRQINDEWTRITPGVNPDGTASTWSMAQTIARAALAATGEQT
jgi:hypothetical protein